MNLDEMFQHVVGRVAQGIRPNDPVTVHYARLMRAFGEHVLGKWSAVSASGLRCALAHVSPQGVRTPCQGPAAGPCVACGTMVCVHHAFTNPTDGSLLCYGCVGKVAPRRTNPEPPPPPPGPDPAASSAAQRIAYLEVLGLPADAQMRQIKARFRQLSKTHHPDLFEPAKRQEAAVVYKRMTEAFNWLMQQEREAA